MADELGFRFTWHGHACVEIESPGGRTILIDPWMGNPRSTRTADQVERCDVMLVTHGHFDHIGGSAGATSDVDAVTIARRTKPAWPGIHELSLWLDNTADHDTEVIGMNAGGTVDARGIEVTMVRAVHSAGDWSTSTGTGLYLGDPVGFVLGLENGRRVYHAGDTDVFGDMGLIRELHRPDVAFLPIGGHFTMSPKGAAKAVQLLGVRNVVPIHYGTFPILAGTPEELRSELSALGLGDVRVLSPEPGQATG
jgi:L-ascorbate metabolism protein UlaG (beta-lactamase superfamily)